MNSEHKDFDDMLKELPWWVRVRMWFLGFGIRRDIRKGRIVSRDICRECWHPIEWNDDAGVCIDCGGRNRRLRNESEGKQS